MIHVLILCIIIPKAASASWFQWLTGLGRDQDAFDHTVFADVANIWSENHQVELSGGENDTLNHQGLTSPQPTRLTHHSGRCTDSPFWRCSCAGIDKSRPVFRSPPPTRVTRSSGTDSAGFDEVCDDALQVQSPHGLLNPTIQQITHLGPFHFDLIDNQRQLTGDLPILYGSEIVLKNKGSKDYIVRVFLADTTDMYLTQGYNFPKAFVKIIDYKLIKQGSETPIDMYQEICAKFPFKISRINMILNTLSKQQRFELLLTKTHAGYIRNRGEILVAKFDLSKFARH